MFQLTALPELNAQTVGLWFQNPFNAGMTLLFALAGSYHGALGIQVVVEDYVHNHALNLTLQLLTKLLMIGMILTSIYAIATLLFG